jgi:beta-lactamase class A
MEMEGLCAVKGCVSVVVRCQRSERKRIVAPRLIELRELGLNLPETRKKWVHAVSVKPETVFQSGSMGKQFTAAAVLLLVEEGKIGLDDP